MFSFHRGKGRIIPDLYPNFHETVRMRMQSEKIAYKPAAKYKPGSEKYVQ